MSNNQPALSFDGFSIISAHIELRNKLANYINGKSKEPVDPKMASCNEECLFAQWLHSHKCQSSKDHNLHNQICNTCEVFLSAASHAILLVNMGKGELAKESYGEICAEASAKFQRQLTRLHYQLDVAQGKPLQPDSGRE